MRVHETQRTGLMMYKYSSKTKQVKFEDVMIITLNSTLHLNSNNGLP